MLKVSFTSENENIPHTTLFLVLYDNKSYLSFEIRVKNQNTKNISIKEIQPVKLDSKKDGYLHFACVPKQISCLVDGYSPGNESKIVFLRDQNEFSGYGTVAFYDQKSKKSLIIGFLENTKSINWS